MTEKKKLQKADVDKKKSRPTHDTDFFRTLEDGVKQAGEQASQLAEKTSKVAEEVLGKVKKGVSEAYDYGSVVLDDLYQVAEKYAEKYKAKVEMRRLNNERTEAITELGDLVFKRHKARKSFDAQFANNRSVTSLFKRIDTLDKEIVALGKKLDEKK